jgi:hypothetical protein
MRRESKNGQGERGLTVLCIQCTLRLSRVKDSPAMRLLHLGRFQ